MKLTPTLLGYLNSVFDKDPRAVVLLRLQYAGQMSWTVSDQVLTTQVTGGPGAGLTVDLTQYTIRDLVTFLAGQAGYTVVYMDASRADLSAVVLLDGGSDQSATNGDHLFGYTSLLWAYMEAVSVELGVAEAAAAAAPGMLDLIHAEGMWLDVIGSYYGVPRIAGEADAQYGPRIIAEALRPRSNNIAIELAVESYTGGPSQVTDVAVNGGLEPLYDGTTTYDGTHTHNATNSIVYGLFDATIPYDLLGGAAPAPYVNNVKGVIERIRAAGTHLRALVLGPGKISDTLTAKPTDLMGLAVAVILADTLTTPTDDLALAPPTPTLADTLAQPNDSNNDLQLLPTYTYSGSRFFNGAIDHTSYYLVDEFLDGTIKTISPLSLTPEEGGVFDTEAGAVITVG